MKNNKNIILLVIAGAGAFYIYNKMKKKPNDAKDTNIKTKRQPTDEIDKAAQKIKNVKKDVAKVKATIKKYVNPQNVKKALNFIKKVKASNTKVKKK